MTTRKVPDGSRSAPGGPISAVTDQRTPGRRDPYTRSMPNSGIPLSEWSGSGATDRLRETIVEFNEATTRQTQQLVRLTWALVVLTVLLFVGLLVQIAVAISQA